MLKLIKTTVLDAAAASVTISNIPQEFKSLKLVVSARSSRGAGNLEDGFGVSYNGTTTNYSYKILAGDGASTSSASTAYEQVWSGRIPASGATASVFGNLEVTIPNYSGSSNKATSINSVTENNATNAYQVLEAQLWSNSAAVTSVVLSALNGNLVAGSTFYLYGIG